MLLVFDASALIKLAKSSILGDVVRSFRCVISEVVFNEVVVEGKRRGYSDALLIEKLVNADVIKVPLMDLLIETQLYKPLVWEYLAEPEPEEIVPYVIPCPTLPTLL
ncbi:MAG: hypothetical protein DRJ36_01680 [Thermoprotei archaeon]|nr:MAG: hypothetical protein DRJ36_01680 [Thermoprotei archaeon]